AEKFMDGSALCDSVGVRILSATIIPRLVVELTPRRPTYTSGDSVNLRVRLLNASPRVGGSGILLIGGGVLTCEEGASVREVAQLQDVWTVQTFNAGSDDTKVHYRIRGQPVPARTR